MVAASVKLLDDTFRTEKNVDVRERLLLVRRVLVDNEQAARVAEKEFHRSRWWAYKWLKRFDQSGLKNVPSFNGTTTNAATLLSGAATYSITIAKYLFCLF
ncbi:MAG: leucine zipper domain-containing protein [Thermoproteota archaeon]|nr:leucine zipper domain-containing protein [Thermoproteota archaeon]